MLRHVVMIKFKSDIDVSFESQILAEMLIKLVDSIDELMAMEVGENISTKPSAMDIVLIADFESEAGLDAYRTHPEHVKVLDYLSEVMEKATVVDYII